jgi:hypothetical protein
MRTSVLKILAVSGFLFLSSGSGWALDYSFSYTCDDQGEVIHPDSTGVFITYLTNTGTVADTYRVVIDKNTLDTLWHCMACLPTVCFFDSIKIVMAPAQVETITVDIFPFGTPGANTLTMQVNSLSAPGQTVAIPVTAITDSGVDVLIVDDDGSENYETYYQAALDAAGRTHGTLDRTTAIIDTGEILPFQAVVWFTGEATPVLTAQDRQIISAYLEGGGGLFISGQDIGYALNDTASGESDASSMAWFQSTFQALYGGEYNSTLIVNGIDGSSISDGCTLSVFGGDGANNQISPDIISVIYGRVSFALPVFYYSDFYDWPDVAAITVDTGFSKLAYFAFGFEAIDNASDRALVMDRVMDWLMTPTAVEEQSDIASRPADFFLSPNYPNPFNATTAFNLVIPEQESIPISIKIYNILGQEVRTLADGVISPGNHLILWDGGDGQGRDLASGIYFSRLKAGQFSQTRKIILTR